MTDYMGNYQYQYFTKIQESLPKPVRRVRLPYLAQVLIIRHLHRFSL